MVEISELTEELKRLVHVPIGNLSQVERCRHYLYLRVFMEVVKFMEDAGVNRCRQPCSLRFLASFWNGPRTALRAHHPGSWLDERFRQVFRFCLPALVIISTRLGRTTPALKNPKKIGCSVFRCRAGRKGVESRLPVPGSVRWWPSQSQ
jgi:hypothetical protein